MSDPVDDQPSADAPDDNSALLAELRAEPAPTPAKRAAPAPADDYDDPDGGQDDAADQLDGDPEPEDADAADPEDEDDAKDPDDDPPADPDPETAKRQAAVRKAEQRGRQALERDRATFERERDAVATEVRSLRDHKARFDGLVAKARYNPTAVLRELGLSDDDFESAAQHIASHSKHPGVTPAHRAAAAKAAAEREIADRLAAVERENKEMREGQVTAAAQQTAVARVDDMLARTHRIARTGLAIDGAAPAAPLVMARLAKNPQATKDALLDVATRLAAQLSRSGKLAPGQLPKPAAVVRAYERELQQLRAELGGDPAPAVAATPGAPAAAGKAKQQIPPQKSKAKPAAVAAVVDDADTGERPTNDQLIRELRGGAS